MAAEEVILVSLAAYPYEYIADKRLSAKNYRKLSNMHSPALAGFAPFCTSADFSSHCRRKQW